MRILTTNAFSPSKRNMLGACSLGRPLTDKNAHPRLAQQLWFAEQSLFTIRVVRTVQAC